LKTPTAPERLPRMAILGRLGTPQLACLRSWRRAGVPCVFLHTGGWPLPALAVKLLGVPCVHLGQLQLDDPAHIARLAVALRETGVQALTCVSEPISVALWAARAQLPPEVRIVSVGPAAVLELAAKSRQHQLARDCGLDTLPSWCFQPGEIAAVPAQYFPIVVRPDDARAAQPAFKVEVVDDAVALQHLIDRALPGSSPLIAQPLVTGPNLLVHAWRDADGIEHGHVGFSVDVKHRGLTVVMRPVELTNQVIEGCAGMARSLGLTGVYHYEFVVDAQGHARFLDLNPRLGGTTGKALAAGYDEPLALVSTVAPGAVPRGAFVSPRLTDSGGKHQALRALWSAVRGASTAADYPYPARGRLVSELVRYLLTGRDELLRGDALPSLLAFALYQTGRMRASSSRGR
jgi:hypothetical protein